LERFYKNREAVGLIVGLVSLGAVFSPYYIFLLALAFLSFAIAREVSKALMVEFSPLLAVLVFLFACLHTSIGIVLSAFFSLVIGYRSWNIEDFLKSFFVLMYAGILPSYIYSIKMMDNYQLLKLLLLVWFVDVISYYTGKNFGRHAFFPKLSPKKTWEGFLGGLVGGMTFFYFISDIPMIYGFLLVLCAVTGDLFKSFVKRQMGIKDFSGVLGEHGGFTDRFDSLLFTAPVYFALLSL
jgi:phosphatidate cytidylyltransferase